MKKIICLILITLCCACANQEIVKIDSVENTVPIYVVHYSWHTGLIINMDDISEQLIPEKRDFAGANFLEIGWGQRDFYRARDYGTGLAFRALFIDNASTMYLHGIYTTPEDEFNQSTLVRLKIAKPKFDIMMQQLSATFKRKNGKIAKSIPHSYQKDSLFYDANGEYGVGNTCNHWTAKMLNFGGIKVKEYWLLPLTASDIIDQASQYGEIIQPHRRDAND